MSADERPPGAVLTDDAQADLADVKPSVANAVLALFEEGRLRDKDIRRYPGRRDWFATRVSYLTVLFRWLEPDELEEHDYRRDARVALIGGIIDLPLPPLLSFLLPAVVAVIALFGATILTPGDLDPDRYDGFFATSAQVIATIFVALVLEARAALAEVRFALLTVVYVAFGLTAAAVALIPELPRGFYEWLIGLTAAGGAGALVSALLLAAWSLTRYDR